MMEQELWCPVCRKVREDAMVLQPCEHIVCGDCLKRLDPPICPQCRVRIAGTTTLPRGVRAVVLDLQGVAEDNDTVRAYPPAYNLGLPSTCPNGHYMGTVDGGDATCVCCLEAIAGEHMHCGVCAVDVCAVCNGARGAIGPRLWWVPRCPRGHCVTPLPCAPLRNGKMACDVCGKECGGGMCHYCVKCGYVKCGRCVHDGPVIFDQVSSLRAVFSSEKCREGCVFTAVVRGSEPARCRLCDTTEDVELSCIYCGVSICAQCHKKTSYRLLIQSSAPAGMHTLRCKANHTMALMTYCPSWYEGAGCDLCGEEIIGSFQHCRACSYDVCSKCAALPIDLDKST